VQLHDLEVIRETPAIAWNAVLRFDHGRIGDDYLDGQARAHLPTGNKPKFSALVLLAATANRKLMFQSLVFFIDRFLPLDAACPFDLGGFCCA
jgi:hypothetical protein